MHTRDCVYQMKSAHIRTEVVTDGDSLLEFVFVIEDMRERERDVRRTFRFRIHVAKHCEATIKFGVRYHMQREAVVAVLLKPLCLSDECTRLLHYLPTSLVLLHGIVHIVS